VGASGARVEAAMGTATEHPDEPEPWVYRIDDTADVAVGAHRNGHHDAPPRELRPVRLPGMPTDGFDDVPADADALLRELHSLAALEERVSPPPPPEAVAPPADTAATPPPPPSGPRAPRPDRDAMYDAFAELSALDAFADELASPATARNGRGPGATNGHGPARNGTRPVNGHTTNGHAANGHQVNGHQHNGHPTGGSDRRQDASPAAVGDHDPSHDADELAALFSSELGSAPAPAPARDPRRPPAAADQLDELFAAAVSTPQLRPRDRAAQGPVPAAPDAAPDAGPSSVSSEPASPAPTAPSGPAAPGTPAPQAAAPDVADDTPAAPASLDLSSFTAKGGTGRKAGRKRLFGR
jgi:hypothetical protein